MKIELKIPSKKILTGLVAGIAILIVVVLFWGPRIILFFQTRFLPFSSSWEAVYMTSGEVYIGKIRGSTYNMVKLNDVYLLHIVKAEETAASSKNFNIAGGPGSNVQLIKWGFQQPLKSKGELFISRSNILFWEKLDKDSEVVKQLEAQRQKLENNK